MNTNPERTAKLNRTKTSVKVAFLIWLLAPAVLCEEVTIYRDGWGVPHIYGDTDRAVAYGYGYAQAEDRLNALIRNYAEATGQLARIEGEAAVSSDFQQRLWGHHKMALREYEQISGDVRQWIVAFAAGVRHYVERNKDRVPEEMATVEPVHLLALTRHLYWRGVLRQLDAEYAQTQTGAGHHLAPSPRGSLWGLAPERSMEDAVTLVADPDESWAPGRKWYEAHLHGRTIHAWGFTYPGMPLPVFGHNRQSGWGWLPEGPDTGDVYAIRFESESSSRYRWGGQSRTAESDTFHIVVGDKATRILTSQTSHLGPIIYREGRTGYAYRVPESLGAGQISHLFDMIRASAFRTFYEAIKSAQLGPATFLYGDTSGTLFYIRSGSVPIRSESIDWDRPVLTDVNSDWLGFHVQEDLIQLLDPHAGWIVDVGTSPDLVTPYSPLIPDRFPRYIYNATPGSQSIWSSRTRSLLESTSRMTLNEVFDVVLDTHVIGSVAWLRALTVAVSDLDPKWSPDEERAFEFLSAWDGRAEPDRWGPALYGEWRKVCRAAGRAVDERSISTSTVLSNETRQHLIKAFREAVKSQKRRYGHLDVRWREIHRSRQGKRSWGLPGVDSENMSSLRRIRSARENVVDYAISGQSAPSVIVFDPKGIRSYSAVPFGQSDHPNSPHSWDQAEVLFTQHRLKPTRFDTKPRDLKKREVLRLPDDLFALPARKMTK